MRVAVIGTGGIGLGMGAFLARDGHRPVLWSPSGRSGALTSVVAAGAVEGAFAVPSAASCAEAVAGADMVVIAVPGTGHRAVMDACAPHLADGQAVVVSSHMSLSAAYLVQRCRAAGCAPTVVAWGTTLVTGRSARPGAVSVSHVRAQLDVAVLPPAEAGRGLALCRTAFGDRFVDRGSLAAIALSNLNPQNHMAIALCNLTRMEKAEDWKQYANTTPAVGRLMTRLDGERLAIAAAYGARVRTLAEHFRLSFGAEGETMGEMAASLAARGADPAGPATLDSRYVLEDVPFGLWPTVCLARAAGVAAPLHEAGVHVFSALYGRDFAGENDILPALGPLPALLGRPSDQARRGG